MEICIACLFPATIYCQADQAYLCNACDAQIHSANKLSQRHIRTPLPSTSSDSSFHDTDQELASIAGIFVKKEAEELLQRSLAFEKLTPQPEKSHQTRQRERQEALTRFRNKRANRSFRKRVRYECRKQLADSRPRVKGRFVGRKSDSA